MGAPRGPTGEITAITHVVPPLTIANLGIGRRGAPKMKENSVKKWFSVFELVVCQKIDL